MMDVIDLFPSRLQGAFPAPPSKSYTHRAALCAALAQGTSHLLSPADGEDIAATFSALPLLGARSLPIEGGVEITGCGGRVSPNRSSAPRTVLCRESGTTLRLLLPLLLDGAGAVQFCGEGRLLSRPLAVYEELCREQGFSFTRTPGSLTVEGRLTPGVYTIPGDSSSQFISGMLLALSRLPGKSLLRITGAPVSRPYVSMTCATMAAFGAPVQPTEDGYLLPGRAIYRPCRYPVEGDWSQAAPLFLLQALGHPLTVTGLKTDSLQGDRACLPYLEAIRQGRPCLSLRDCPDLGPVLMVAAAMHHGARLTGARRLRDKESDRLAAMAAELGACGVQVTIEEDAVTVGGGAHAPRRPLQSHGDHRIAMALSPLLLTYGGRLCGGACVAKSWPGWFSLLARHGAVLQEGAPQTK